MKYLICVHGPAQKQVSHVAIQHWNATEIEKLNFLKLIAILVVIHDYYISVVLELWLMPEYEKFISSCNQ